MKPRLLIADKNKKIFDVPGLTAVGSKTGTLSPLDDKALIKLPYGSELFTLPDRYPVGYCETARKFITLTQNPCKKKPEACYAVAAFISPGYTACYSTAYIESKGAKLLPLFSYSAVCLYRGEFYVPAVRVDRERRQDLRLMNIQKIQQNVKRFRKLFGKNRLFKHLIRCALTYHCPAGKNFFLQRYECPLPTSTACNSRCIGCISFQSGKECPITQPRISFTPTPREIAEIALFHIRNVRRPVVSFGQGCEGEPLMAGGVLFEAISLIRKETKKGTINLNTNASKPKLVEKLVKSGLDSIRVSVNSLRPRYYNRYYKPIGYGFADVLKSIELTKKAGGFVSINYLTMPGFTDDSGETKALMDFLKRFDIDMIQWRNLNYDPLSYAKQMGIRPAIKDMVGIAELIEMVKKRFPRVMHGYFNPPREKWLR
ncbi:MAG: radical SAM protein [Candidatus Omnitrophica bacterium]|nr:radical SAM protein [Candidatus Omnitrophota bacterium]